jgi:hypothetical protein
MSRYDDPNEPSLSQRMTKAVGTDLLRDIIGDSRRSREPSSVIPSQPSSPRPPIGNGRGWAEPPKVDDWRPPGMAIADRLFDQDDAQWRAELAAKLAKRGG